MDVVRGELSDAVTKLRKALRSPKAAFVAIDEEFTGISFNNASFQECNPLSDSASSRYAKMRRVAQSFGLMQLGIAVFEKDGDTYRSSVFNCYVFAAEVPGGRDVNLSTGAISFLRKNSMDFGTWLTQGIPYVDAAGEARLLQEARDPPPRNTFELRDASSKVFADAELAKVEVLSNQTAVKQMDLQPHQAAVVRKYLHQEIERRFPFIATEKGPLKHQIRCVLLTESEKERRDQVSMQRRLDDVKEHKIGARALFVELRDACRDKKLPLVGHNCLYDLLFLLEHFEQPLPEAWADFKTLVSTNFPIIVDTKAFAPRAGFPERRTALDQCYEAVQASQGAQVRFARGFGKYGPEESSSSDDSEDGEVNDEARTAAFRAALDAPRRDPRTSQRFHEAGWDAYTTGVVYLRLLEKTTERCENRLHFMRSCYEIDLGLGDAVEPIHPVLKGAAYHVRVETNAQPDDIRTLVTTLGASDIYYVQRASDDGREWCVDVAGELQEGTVKGSAVPWLCFEAERGALLTQEPASTGSWSKKAAKKLRTWLAKRLGMNPASPSRKRPARAASPAAKRQK